jgi:hypothetical protein
MCYDAAAIKYGCSGHRDEGCRTDVGSEVPALQPSG